MKVNLFSARGRKVGWKFPACFIVVLCQDGIRLATPGVLEVDSSRPWTHSKGSLNLQPCLKEKKKSSRKLNPKPWRPPCVCSTMEFLHSRAVRLLRPQRRRQRGVSLDTVSLLSYLEGRKCRSRPDFRSLLWNYPSSFGTTQLSFHRLSSCNLTLLYGLSSAVCCSLLD